MRLAICLLLSIGLVVAHTACKEAKQPSTQPAPAALTKAAPATQPIDPKKDGTYTAGPWQYEYRVSNAGSRSEGYYGMLTYAGQPVAEPKTINDYHVTPWGNLYWVGQPVVQFGGHGWMPKPKVSAPAGRPLPEPGTKAAPVVMMIVLGDSDQAADPKLDPWIAAELKAQGVQNVAVQRPWVKVTEQLVMIHDTKLYGRLYARLGSGTGDTISVIVEGVQPTKIDIPRKTGATKLVKQTLADHLGNQLPLYLAFRVDE